MAIGALSSLALPLGAYFLIALLDRTINVRTPAMIFLASVMLAAIWFGQIAALGAALVAFALYNYLVVQPASAWMFSNVDPYLTLAVFVGAALLIGSIAGRLHDEKVRAARQARIFETLFRTSKAMAAQTDMREAMAVLTGAASELGAQGAVVLYREADAVRIAQVPPDAASPGEIAITKAGEVLQGTAGMETSAESWRLTPIRGVERPLAVLAYRASQAAEKEQSLALGLLADLARTSFQHIAAMEQKSQMEAAAEANKLRSAMIASVSHDFRTPLATIIASASSLQDYGADFAPATRADLLSSIQNEAERLNRFVGDLLDMTRLDADALQLNWQWIDPTEVIEAVHERVSRQAPSHAIIIEAPAAAPALYIDRLLLEQALTNVMENAFRHTPAGTTVRVGCAQEGQAVSLWVEDDGPGVKSEDLPRIFEKFFQSRVMKPAGGSGLGLAIAKGFVEAMHGVVRAESPAGDGAGLRVSFVFPRQAEQTS